MALGQSKFIACRKKLFTQKIFTALRAGEKMKIIITLIGQCYLYVYTITLCVCVFESVCWFMSMDDNDFPFITTNSVSLLSTLDRFNCFENWKFNFRQNVDERWDVNDLVFLRVLNILCSNSLSTSPFVRVFELYLSTQIRVHECHV